MKEHLLKRALPFTLTFVIGAAVGGFIQLLAARGAAWFTKRDAYTYSARRGCDKKFRRHHAAHEYRRPVILFKADARLPADYVPGTLGHGARPVRVSVTFGEDGAVRAVEALDRWTDEMSESAESAARKIKFLPATRGGVPATVTEEVIIRFSSFD